MVGFVMVVVAVILGGVQTAEAADAGAADGRDAIAQAGAQRRARHPKAASLTAAGVLSGDPDDALARAAMVELALALDALGHREAARLVFHDVLAGDMDPASVRALRHLVAWDPSTVDVDLAALVANLPVNGSPVSLQGPLHRLQGVDHVHAGRLAEARAALQDTDDPQSRLMQALVEVEQGLPKTGAFHLIQVAGGPDATATRDLARLNLARWLVGQDRLADAAAIWASIDPSRPDWARAREEQAWAWLRMGETGRALGNVLALESARGQAELTVEAPLIAGVAYAEACRWDVAAAVATALQDDLTPQVHELQTWLADARPETAVWDWFGPGPRPTVVSEAVFRSAFRDQRLSSLMLRRRALQAEAAALASSTGPRGWDRLSGELQGRIAAERERVETAAGEALIAGLQAEVDRMQRAIASAAVLAFEASDGQRRELEALARTGGATPTGDALIDYAVSEDIIMWPFNGEFWEDELDAYAVDVQRACPAPRDLSLAPVRREVPRTGLF